MSIPNLIYKIKSKTGIDKVTLLYLFIIVGVGIGAFGLGRISTDISTIKNDNSSLSKIQSKGDQISTNTLKESEELNNTQVSQIEKRYVASKNGKMYYSIGCSGASRIKDENQIWFRSTEDAEKSGYALASACK